MRRIGGTGLLLLVVATLVGCRPSGGGAPAPTPRPAPAGSPRPAAYRVAVVDLGALLRAHRRWGELEALHRRIGALQVRLASPPPAPEPPKTEVGPDLQAEADRLQASLKAELEELRQQLQRRVEAYANDVKAEQEAKLADRQRELNVALSKTVEAKRDELQRELERFELATMAEYRIPLLNLRVKADVVGIANEEEVKRIQAESDRLHKERDEKVRVHAQALDRQMQEFVRTSTAEAEATFNAYVASLEDEARVKIEAKEREARAEFDSAVRQREETFRTAMESRRKLVMDTAQTQLRAAQEQYARQVEAEAARLRAELQALDGQRVRLEDSMLAEIKIEVATVAQERRIDVVVTQTIAHRGVIDITPAVIARLRRS